MELFRPPLERPRSDSRPCLFSRLEDPSGGGRGPEPDWSCEEDVSLFLSLLLYMHFIPHFLTPMFMCVCVFENARFFFGNVFLAALKCLTYFIRSSKTFYKYLFVRIHLKYCLERNDQTSPELTTLCLCPGSQEKEVQSSKPLWSVGTTIPFCLASLCT